MAKLVLRILETNEEIETAVSLQMRVWTGSETGTDPAHMLKIAVKNGGLIIGAFLSPKAEFTSEEVDSQDISPALAWSMPFLDAGLPAAAGLVGFVFGFPGLYTTPDGPRLKHCSHMLGVDPKYRDLGVGFALKRAQWQMVRHQGLDRITWTYDPLLSRNAYLNIAKLGAVCNNYLRNAYGDMPDEINAGLPTDRFQVDWWVNTQRVRSRLSRNRRLPLDLANFLSAETKILNPTWQGEDGLPRPTSDKESERALDELGEALILLLEIPSDFNKLRRADHGLAYEWRMHARFLFEALFERGYLATDFVFLSGSSSRSFYVLSNGDATL